MLLFVFDLEVRAHDVFVSVEQLREVASGKSFSIEQNAADLLEVVAVVGDDEKLSAQLENASDLFKKRWLKQTSATVTTLRPRVGKIHVHAKDAIRRDVAEGEARVGAEHFRVGQVRSPESVGSVGSVGPSVLDAQQIDLPMLHRTRENEGSLAPADFDFDGLLGPIREHVRPMESGFCQVVRQEALARVPVSAWRG